MSYSTPTSVVYQHVIKQPTNGLAVTSLVLGIVAIASGIWSPIPIVGLFAAFFGGLPALLAVIFGHFGYAASHRIGVGRGNAIAGLVLGYVTLGIIVLTTLFWIVAIAGSASTSGSPA
jgi:hypothetical protein